MGEGAAEKPQDQQEPTEPPATQQDGDTEPTAGKRKLSGMAAARARGEKPAKGWRAPSPAHLVELRVSTVARAIVDGLGRAGIHQATSKAQQKEAADREKARQVALKGGIEPAEAEADARRAVPILWGDEPIPERTLDSYIKRAKDAIGDEGKRLSRHRDYVLGMQLARCNEVYQAAFKKERYSVCVQIIREVNEMFGTKEAIKLLILNAPGADAAAAAKEGDPQNLSTDEGRGRAFAKLIQTATRSDPTLAPIISRFASAVSLGAGGAASPGAKDGNGSGNGKH